MNPLPKRTSNTPEPPDGDGANELALEAFEKSMLTRLGDRLPSIRIRRGRPAPDEPDDPPWWMIHIPVEVVDVHAALALADVIAQAVAPAHPAVVAGAIAVSHEETPDVHHPVYCDKRVPLSNRRCGLHAAHHGICTPRTG
jgi:hypothetical protein